jgi:hypothetical protein
MDVAAVRESLAQAVEEQGRSLLLLTAAAGSLRGLVAGGLRGRLREVVQDEVRDTYILAEKLAALGGTIRLPASGARGERELPTDPGKVLELVVDQERQTLKLLHGVIPSTGQEPRSEALEHTLEHVIMRKQRQIDELLLLLGRSDA